MAYKVVVGGVVVECDSADEAVEIAKRLSGGDAQSARGSKSERPAGGGGGSSRWTDARIGDFMKLVEGKGRRLLDALVEHPDGRTDEQLSQMLGFSDNRALAGVFTGLWKNAKKVGADPNDLYSKQRVKIHDRRVFEYVLTDSFRSAFARVKGK